VLGLGAELRRCPGAAANVALDCGSSR
jgi:hypothetical protein